MDVWKGIDMPRQARLDAPGTLHHVMIRGIERSPIFEADRDRQDFISRIGILAQETGTRDGPEGRVLSVLHL